MGGSLENLGTVGIYLWKEVRLHMFRGIINVLVHSQIK